MERLNFLWQHYKIYFIGLFICIIVSIASIGFYKNHQYQALKVSSEQFDVLYKELFDSTSSVGLEEWNKFSENHPNSYGVLAQFHHARHYQKIGEVMKAVKIYENLSQNKDLSLMLRDFAYVNAVSLQIGRQKAVDIDNLLSKLRHKQNAFRHSAYELTALAYMQEKQYEKAMALYDTALLDQEIPQTLASRLSILRNVVSFRMQ